jgi:protein-tyrosine phosphatase
LKDIDNKTGVVAFHCNHGKGRTGTAIISFMLYMSLFEKAN